MGRVVPFSEIKNLPTKETFPKAIADLRSELGKIKEEGLIRGAMLYGSSAIGTYTLRSDIDCIVISNEGKEGRVDYLLSENYTRFRKAYGIPVQFVHYSDADVEDGVHSITPHLHTHLKLVEKETEIIGESPAGLIGEKQDILYDAKECLIYMFNTLKRKGMVELRYHMMEQDAEYFKVLQKAVEMPANAIRTVFAAVDNWPMLEGRPTDRTPQIYDEYARYMVNHLNHPDLHDMLNSIIKVDKEYTSILERLRSDFDDSTKSHEEYQLMLLQLENTIPLTTSFVKENLRMLSDMI
jgi:predicted nucleotidyltransferase